ncbi:PREDICTED: centrosomal protein of 290 kDa isoform X2 [Wasmannia auropunctata]|uniref:centrosomal protein of 290 kDa isoform X2 n=1 Tax=Wasmannia auropunctata TaxID=64793 RepID=UPI0005F0B40F|nr:PREDICTED: centrosomal protein of 290 kDa isoform X2 [Wasmannia auropunctata]
MVRTDWDRILSVNASSLTDEEIEDLFPAVVRCDVDEIADTHGLRTLVRLSQEMLTYKDNQVEALLLECGELKETIASLRPETAKRKIKDRGMVSIKQENDSFTKDTDLRKYSDTQGKSEKIKTLMAELETLDKENEILKEQLTTLKDEMEDATEKMNEMTEELRSAQVKTVEYKEKILKLEQENTALIIQIEDVTALQVDRDKMLDEFGIAIDARISEWKGVLDEKDAEITRLKESLSHSLMQSITSAKEENKTQIVHLNDEIARRDTVIAELQTKLSEAVVEINESAALIEKLKGEAHESVKSDKRKEQKSLLKKIQIANEKISNLENALSQAQDDAKSQSSKLCEVLSTLKEYEDGNQALSKALNEIKELKIKIDHKNEHIEDLTNVINKLEMLNSYQEMEILTLREKLGLPEDESISIKSIVAKRKEESKKMEKLIQQNKSLVEENLELKSDIRMLKYKLSKSEKILDISDSLGDSSNQFLHSTKLVESENMQISSKIDISEVNRNIQILIEENEALRTGMHEIMDSIRNQDGKSEVEIQSSTLERLLEALDVRHLAGWYHPAMRLQEHLNVVQGSNAELRSQLKLLRKELQRKDNILQDLAANKDIDFEKFYEKHGEDEVITMYLAEMKALQTAYKNETDEWEKQKDLLIQESNELKDEIDGLRKQLEIYKKNWQIIENGDDEAQKAFAAKTREFVDAANERVVMNRKNVSLQQLLNKETNRLYEYQKEIIKKEGDFNRALTEANKYSKTLLSELSLLQSNLSNSVSVIVHNELKEKYEELNMRHHALLETAMISPNFNEMSSLKAEIEAIRQEKIQLIQDSRKADDCVSDDSLQQKLKEIEAKESIERQRADQMARLLEISQTQLTKYEDNVKQLSVSNSELQERLIEVHKTLSKNIMLQETVQMDDNRIHELQNEKTKLFVENQSLKKMLQISEEEARLQYSLNSLQTLELDSLRHQILDLQAVSEDKATISRLDFELTSKKISEMELSAQKTRLQNELSCVRQELDNSKKRYEEMRGYVQDYRKQCDNRCKYYTDIIYFLQCQYAGSTSISTLEKVITLAAKLKTDRQNIDAEMQKTKKCHEDIKYEQQYLSARLEIVERLKDMLEQQIGAGSVQNIMEHYAETSQQTLSDFKYKRRITHLEHELQIANSKFNEYESVINSMEQDMLNIQRAWCPLQEQQARINQITSNLEAKSIQVTMETQVVSVQTDPYICCLSKKTEEATKETDKETVVSKDSKEYSKSSEITEKTFREVGSNTEETASSILNEQLDQTLKLASERSAMLVKCQSQLTEYKAKVDALNKAIAEKDSQYQSKIATLNKAIEERDSQYQVEVDTLNKAIEEKDSYLAQKQDVLDELMTQPQVANTDSADKLALKSTINSLQKLIQQKEETILRYQNLLKEDRDEHSRAASRFQDEIKNLHDHILAMQGKIRKSEDSVVTIKNVVEKTSTFDGITTRSSAMQEEEIARLHEKVSTLEAELNISKELSERWHQLADERLMHMDRMRERLEQQHKNELESYRGELNKWQSEADVLRQQLSENRMLLTKGNISLMKELQDKDDKIHELTLACQQLQNEVELIESANRSQQMIVYTRGDMKAHETAHSSHRDQTQQQNQVDVLRRQIQSLMEKEKMYKYEITDLKQQLSRRYMAIKTQEKKISQRETQLERKVTALEEELHKTKTQLDREYLAQGAKRAKTAEELSLWEKQKKWQQTAEKLKEKLKGKTDEYEKLLANYEKLRSVVSCMEREKWYLRSKLKFEGDTLSGTLSGRPISNIQRNTVEEQLEKECRILRDRVKELTDRLEKESNEHLMLEIAELKRHNAALEAVSQGNTCVISQLEKLEMAKDVLEKMNIKLESENFELRLALERANSDTPGLREKVDHLEKYIKLLKAEKSSDSTPRSSEKELPESSNKKPIFEMEKTIFTLKRIIEKLQAENKRLKLNSKKNHFIANQGKNIEGGLFQRQYEESQKRVVSLEADLRLAEQRVAMLEEAQKEDDNGDFRILKQQLMHKSELLDKMKQLLTRAAINEKTLRQRVQQLESKQTLSTIPECYVTPPTPQ